MNRKIDIQRCFECGHYIRFYKGEIKRVCPGIGGGVNVVHEYCVNEYVHKLNTRQFGAQ